MYWIKTLPASCFHCTYLSDIPASHRMSQKGQYAAYVASSQPSIWHRKTRVTFPRKGFWQSTWIHDPPCSIPTHLPRLLKLSSKPYRVAERQTTTDRHPSSEPRVWRSICTYKFFFKLLVQNILISLFMSVVRVLGVTDLSAVKNNAVWEVWVTLVSFVRTILWHSKKKPGPTSCRSVHGERTLLWTSS